MIIKMMRFQIVIVSTRKTYYESYSNMRKNHATMVTRMYRKKKSYHRYYNHDGKINLQKLLDKINIK